MKTILVPVGGSETDKAVFAAALTIARKCNSHITGLHVLVDPADAAFNTPHLRSARGAAIGAGLRDLKQRAESRQEAALRSFDAFCTEHSIERVDGRNGTRVTASWVEGEGTPVDCILRHARFHDLVIMGRPATSDGLPQDRLETMLLRSGRPVLVVPSGHHMRALDKPMLCWKETPEAIHALGAAMPILAASHDVVVVTVKEKAPAAPRDLMLYLKRHGAHPRFHEVEKEKGSTFAVLRRTAHELSADVMIMGGFGKSALQELVFGGVTQEALEQADLPLFLMH